MGTLLIDKLLQTVVTQKASDLHLTVGSKPMLRLGGHMVPLNTKVLESSRHLGLDEEHHPRALPAGVAGGWRVRLRVRLR